jgi:hypothetical protein
MAGPNRGLFALVMIVSVAVIVSGCTGSAKLRHPTTQKEATCGPYALKFGMGLSEFKRCMDDYQRQGYERVPD